MLDLAIKYEEILQKKFIDTWIDDKYKFFNSSSYHEKFGCSTTTWSKVEMVSLDKSDEVIGYFSYDIDRDANRCYNLAIINFSDNIITFGRDLYSFLESVFIKHNHRKLTFSVIIGNPIEKSYDKVCKKYNGRIVGVYKEHEKLTDGKYYDKKIYEILQEDFMSVYKETKKLK